MATVTAQSATGPKSVILGPTHGPSAMLKPAALWTARRVEALSKECGKKSSPSPNREGSRLRSSNDCPHSVMAGLGPAIHDLRAQGAPRGREPARPGGA